MLSFVKVEPGAKGTLHHHPEEQWGYVLSGGGKRFQGDEVWEFGPGDFWRTPGGVPHTVEGGPEGALILDVFAPPREAYRKAGSGFAQE
jgi:quercetin dioxygenase-like cupin family protein